MRDRGGVHVAPGVGVLLEGARLVRDRAYLGCGRLRCEVLQPAVPAEAEPGACRGGAGAAEPASRWVANER